MKRLEPFVWPCLEKETEKDKRRERMEKKERIKNKNKKSSKMI